MWCADGGLPFAMGDDDDDDGSSDDGSDEGEESEGESEGEGGGGGPVAAAWAGGDELIAAATGQQVRPEGPARRTLDFIAEVLGFWWFGGGGGGRLHGFLNRRRHLCVAYLHGNGAQESCCHCAWALQW